MNLLPTLIVLFIVKMGNKFNLLVNVFPDILLPKITSQLKGLPAIDDMVPLFV
jgi:hypothetical protein